MLSCRSMPNSIDQDGPYPVVLVIGHQMMDLPVNAPPITISPYSPSIPPALSIRERTLVPNRNIYNTLSLRTAVYRTVRFLRNDSFLVCYSAILAQSPLLITTEFAADGSWLGSAHYSKTFSDYRLLPSGRYPAEDARDIRFILKKCIKVSTALRFFLIANCLSISI